MFTFVFPWWPISQFPGDQSTPKINLIYSLIFKPNQRIKNLNFVNLRKNYHCIKRELKGCERLKSILTKLTVVTYFVTSKVTYTVPRITEEARLAIPSSTVVERAGGLRGVGRWLFETTETE